MRPMSVSTMLLLWIAFLWPTSASAYCLKKVVGATPYVAWKTPPVKYKVSSNLKDPKILKAIDDAFTTWGSVPCSKLSFAKDGTFDIAKTKFDGHHTEAILVFWYTNKTGFPTDPKYIAYTFLSHDNAGGFAEASIAVNAFTTKFPWGTEGKKTTLDVQGELTTLIGQVIGLTTSNTTASVMQDTIKFADVAKRTLAPDDIDALHQLYNKTACPAPPAPGANGCTANPPPGPDGSVVKPDGGPPIVDGSSPVADGSSPPPKKDAVSPVSEAGVPLDDHGLVNDSGIPPSADAGGKACVSSDQCASDEICTAEGNCVKFGGGGDDGGCCSVATAVPPEGLWLLLLVLGAVWITTRRRR